MNLLSKYFHKMPIKLVGVGVTAFNRSMPAFFTPGYQIICYKNSLDVPEIEKICRVLSIERDCQEGVRRLNSLAILKHPEVQAYLKKSGQKIGIFIYKSSARIEKTCEENGWQIIGNRSQLRDPLENKKIFREYVKEIGLQPIEGEVMALKDFNENVFLHFQKKFGPKLVLKLPEVIRGGGVGNTYAQKPADLKSFWQKVARFKDYYQPQSVIIERQITQSLSCSITGCTTRFGVLTGVVQTQILDIPEVINVSRGSGMFVGHDWSFKHYSASIQQQAEHICRRFGEFIYQKGYRGIFGIDLLVEQENGCQKVYPCECNPRFTGAFPVYSMIQLRQKEIPMDVFHLLEHLRLDYKLDFDEVQSQYRSPKEGAQIIIHNRSEDWMQAEGELKAGVYRLVGEELEFIRPGFSMIDLKSSEEFVLTDGVPRKGAKIKPNLRILKILFPQKILASDGKAIDKRTKGVVESIYWALDLKAIEPPKEYIIEDTEF